MTSGLKVAEVGFRAAGREILHDVSFDVGRGETLALIGPSGSGKTTLLRIVAGLERAHRGRVFFADADVTRTAAHRRGFGMMFQEHALFPHLDVAANVEFGLREARWAADRRKARREEMLELVGLAGFGKRTIERLSGGERQRVALARSLAPGPGLLMLDEPLGSLDRGLRERLASELRPILRGLEVTAIYVTHDQVEAFTVADRIAIMNEGELVRIDTPRSLWRDPRTTFVARFLGMQKIVPGTRDQFGLVRTGVGTFGPIEGPSGAVALLVRGENAEVVGEPGTNVVAGVVAARDFRGATVSVEVVGGGETLRFDLGGDVAIPQPGSEIFVRVKGPQVVSAD